MNKIGILLKTYVGDIDYVQRLLASYWKHNVENIPLYIVAPQNDIGLFKRFLGDNVEVYSDETITKDLVTDNSVFGIRPGYINQEIIKLAFWEKKLCENYFCMDSDGIFIRDFFVSDFMYDDETPYTILVEDNELAVEPEYYSAYWKEREKLIRLIQREVGLKDNRMLTCHGFAILSSKVSESLYTKFMLPNKLKYKDLLSIAPYEFSWYNMWLQKDKTIKIEFREHIVKYFHHKNHHLEYLQRRITLKDIARGYIGIAVNSNYSRQFGVVSYEDGDIYDLSMDEIKTMLVKITHSLLRKVKKKSRSLLYRS